MGIRGKGLNGKSATICISLRPALILLLLSGLLLFPAGRGQGEGRRVPLEWTAPPVEFRSWPDGSVEIVAGNYEVDARPGAPRLPFTSTLIAIPPGTTPLLRILSAEAVTLPLRGPVAITPRTEGGPLNPAGFSLGPALAPADPLPSPSAPVLLEEMGTLRGVRLARVAFYPAVPEEGHLRVYRRVRAEVVFVPLNSRGEIAQREQNEDFFLKAVRRAVRNPQDAIPALPARPTPAALRPQGSEVPEAFLEISRPGLYRVTYGDLQPLGFGGANPANFRLFRGPDEVAYEWAGDDDAVLEPGEALLFYAEPRFSRWTGRDVYRLVADAVPGMRMPAQAVVWTNPPAGTPWVERVFEENRVYVSSGPPGRDGDRWFWADLKRPGPSTFSATFALNADVSRPATLTLWLIGYTAVVTSPDHRVDVFLNDVFLGRWEWDGKTGVTATLSVPPGVLAPTSTLHLSLPGIPTVNVEGAWLDAFALRFAGGPASWGESVAFATSIALPETPPASDFPHRLYLPLVVRGAGAPPMRAYTLRLNPSRAYWAYQITDPLRPIRVLTLWVEGQQVTLSDSGDRPRRYFVATEEAIRAPDRVRPRAPLWLSPAGEGVSGADYLIIAHPAFADALGPLINLRRSQGLTVAVASVLGVYDAYGDGRPDPEAVRRFIADAYTTWNPRPTFVLLVGDGSYDPKRYRPESPPTFVPPYLADVDPTLGETAADNRYACVDGNDTLPDLLLGRLPVKTADEARAVVRKIVDYETNPLPGGWNASVLLVADDQDWAGNFPALSDAVAAWVTAPFTVTRRYCLGNDPGRDDCDAEAPALHAALLGDWNQGAFLVQYFGHASWQQWVRERVFHLDDLPSLRNSRRYPVLAEMTCFTGMFHRPEPTLDEALVTLPDAGAVAAWGPTGLSLATGHRRLADGLFRAVFSDTVATVGEATLAGKLNLAAGGLYLDLLDTYVLLGDPALRWNRTILPWTARLYLPLVVRNSP
ncbi:MAG: C25 family cysteine peptidase [Anaerolineae bacterium]|nr:C25 family cysteine peptidase [Anaerolineae bacterium]MDW7992236.1 C25 family cysteine peptidase [Anaerolineae bacterium]